MNITTVGIDLAKTSFSLVGMDNHGKIVLRKTLTRSRLLPFIAQLSPCLIGMEACSGAHHWGRQFRELGHQVGLIAVKFVEPYRKGGKNDNNDAEAICEAVRRPNLRFVPIKSVDQQALLCVHRVRQALVWDRTRLLNQLRGLLSEFGIVMVKGRYPAQHIIPAILEDDSNGLPMIARRTIEQLWHRLQSINADIAAYDRDLVQQAKSDERARRLMTIPGVGELTATGVIASVPDSGLFKDGRQFAAWLGLVPRQYTTGNKIRLGRITKQGDQYLRTCLVHGARAVVASLGTKQDHVSCWLRALLERRGYLRAVVALAARNARLIWVLLHKGEDYRVMPIAVQ